MLIGYWQRLMEMDSIWVVRNQIHFFVIDGLNINAASPLRYVSYRFFFFLLDIDVAHFLLSKIPLDWQKRHKVTLSKMQAALTMVRQSASLKGLGFEERVRRALLVVEATHPPTTW
jgi:hypothetical protein